MAAKPSRVPVLILIVGCLIGVGHLRAEEQATSKVVVPVFDLSGALLESPAAQDPFFGSLGASSLKDLVSRLEKARDDQQVKAIVILLGDAGMGTAQLEEVHAAISQIRQAGKPVYAHADSLSFGKLALLSASSHIAVAPVGDLFITGLYGAQPHLRGLLDKIHVTPDYITCGEYKSAAEIFMRGSPSPEARRMQDWLFDSIFDNYVGLIADGRGKSREEVRGWIDRGLYSAEKAAEIGIIDAAEFRRDLLERIQQQHGDQVELDRRYGKKKRNTLDFSNPFSVFKMWADLLSGPAKATAKPAVAIVYVEGAILPGKAQPSPFGSQGMAYSDPIRRALDKAADDDSVKAVVLRVNSPGGSAVASEIILQATRRVAAKKPFVVSMGDVAGSGGYYVSCGAETIFADPSTITGSIGVVAGKLATEAMWESVGVNWHPVERGENAGMLYSGKVFTDSQKEMLQAWMDEVYEEFKQHVAKIRGDRLAKPIDELAGGRVFTGRQAAENGLVDRLGSLDDAIEFVAEKAELDEYDVRVIPRAKNFVELLLADLTDSGDDDDERSLRLASQLRSSWQTQSLWDAAAPLLKRLDPSRVAAIQRALLQLETLQRERLSLAMPEFVIQP